MKLKFLYLIFAIWCTGSTAFSTWIQRMQKYGSLVKCEYYLTSEDQYRDDFPLDEIATKTADGFAYQLHYFVLTKNSTKLRIANNTMTFPPIEDYDDESTTDENGDLIPSPKYLPPPLISTYEIIVGETVEKQLKRGCCEVVFERNTETYIIDADVDVGRTLKSVVTPNIIQSDEPTEINVDVYKNGILKLYVNKVITLIVRVKNLTSATHVSFASTKDKERQEFFYNCQA